MNPPQGFHISAKENSPRTSVKREGVANTIPVSCRTGCKGKVFYVLTAGNGVAITIADATTRGLLELQRHRISINNDLAEIGNVVRTRRLKWEACAQELVREETQRNKMSRHARKMQREKRQ